MKKIKLSCTYNSKHSKLNLFSLVDDEDYDFLSKWNWSLKTMGRTHYAVRQDSKTKKIIRMHRVIMNTPIELEVDHINHDGLDNQKSNLRNCTHAENTQNASARKNYTSKHRGITILVNKYKCKNGEIRTTKPKFRAQIGTKESHKHIGSFLTEREAVIAYNNEATKRFGQFANLNKVD